MKPEDAPRGELKGEFHEIHLAAGNRDVARVKQLLEAGVDADTRNTALANGDGGNTPLWFAAQGPKKNGEEVAKVLVDAGADVNAICEHGTTAAHLACSWGHVEILAYLYQKGADLSIKDADGMTPEKTARKGYNWQLTRTSDEKRSGVVTFFDNLAKRG